MKAGFVAALASMMSCAFVQFVSAEDAHKAKVNVLHSFSCCTDGQTPEAGLIDVNGTLYGTTYFGGANCMEEEQGCGSVFSLDLTTGAETVLYSFCNKGNYCSDGQYPDAALIAVKGKLYGTTEQVDVTGSGTVFSINPKTGREKVLHAFPANGSDGQYPHGGLIDVKGTLYGTTIEGGANGNGTVYAIDPDTGVETVIHSFQSGSDGQQPYATLIDVKGMLYGTTLKGGTNGYGTVFSIDPNSGAEKVLYSFCALRNCADGKEPTAGVIDVNGAFYGTTFSGGNSLNGGTVFALDPNTGTETTLYTFCSQASCTDGQNPFATLTAANGKLYGTTGNGGAQNYGIVFSLNLSTGAEKRVYSFCSRQYCADGEYPDAGLIAVNGELYGTATYGGTSGLGTVFALKP